MTRSLLNLVLASLITAMGCGEGALESGEVSSSAASDALLIAGKADVGDTACNVVLRAVSRVGDSTGGYVTSCTKKDGCWWVL